ncbi:phosphoribosyltransferase [Pseudoroseicyclus tamaricis]|uniref:Phosphoribosyltransferase domain-containing protein n=1 Tax=Pseudoroseicyclus tamaricis TaxID=2705421 RepID=A0A6B2JPF1_9RHOB|nr:phosphoribosyltransferase family protein [Pseudoroseicyclus tamaricis]NDU99869.1 hypothetical protein [Pseudoroseicyclus tamaricis]
MVITLSKAGLETEARRLARRVRLDGYVPQLVVGIRRGGEHVARMAMEEFPEGRLALVNRQRPGTKIKGGLRLGAVLPHLPYTVTDSMRRLEHRVRFRRHARRPAGADTGRHAEPEGHGLGAGNFDERRILVIDDAVDSGETMTDVVSYLGERFPRAEIRTFAIAHTMPHSVLRPDYAAFACGNLVRFFWSEDYHARA